MKNSDIHPCIYILNGPNLNLLGKREPELYGYATLEDIEKMAQDAAERNQMVLEFRQSNHEGQLIDWVQEAGEKADILIINAAAYTHTSIGLFDALKMIEIPVIELHISQTHLRESFRHHSFISLVAKGIIAGFGAKGYTMAIDYAKEMLKT